jgi:large subunit ribosomal protein L17
MRHGKKFNHLGRTAPHRKAMLSNMACSLIEHKRINTTVAKAKALRVYVEPLLTKAKEDTTHNRRTVFSYLQSKEAVAELFRTVAPKIAERNGGYTRIIKTGFRQGDAADMAMIELVDFNDLYNPNEEEKKATRRSRRGTAVKKEAVATIPAAAAEATEAPAKEEVKSDIDSAGDGVESTQNKTD